MIFLQFFTIILLLIPYYIIFCFYIKRKKKVDALDEWFKDDIDLLKNFNINRKF